MRGIIEDDKLQRAWGTQRDITERKKIEERIIETKNKIEQLHKTAIQLESVQNKDELYTLTIH